VLVVHELNLFGFGFHQHLPDRAKRRKRGFDLQIARLVGSLERILLRGEN